MRFERPLVEGRLRRRYQRFLADVELDDGRLVTAHTANPGRMLGLTAPGSQVFLSHHTDPKRKLAYTWELVRVGRSLVGVNPIRSNRLVREAIERGRVPELWGYPTLRSEVAVGSSRIDLLLEDGPRRCYVEVKSATLVEGRHAMFPDAVTARGRRHLEELCACVRQGHRSVTFFAMQRGDVDSVGPADSIDPEYGRALRRAAAAGVEIYGYRARTRRTGVELVYPVAIRL